MSKPKKALYEVLGHFDENKKKLRLQYRPLHPTLRRILYKNSLLGDKAMYKTVTEARLKERPLLANGDWCNEAESLSLAATYHKIMKNPVQIEKKLNQLLADAVGTSISIDTESLAELVNEATLVKLGDPATNDVARAEHIESFRKMCEETETEIETN